MATTTNYGWTTPDDTALVKDGASAIRTLGSSVDTTTKNLNPETTLGDIAYRSSTANVNTRLPLGTAGQVLKVNSGATAPEWATDASGMTNPMTTTADTIYSSSGSTPARLGIGTAGQVLTVNSGATAPEWATLSSGGMTLISTTTFNNTASTYTVSSIAGTYKNLLIIGTGLQTAASSLDGIAFRFNGDTGANYNQQGVKVAAGSVTSESALGVTSLFGSNMGTLTLTSDSVESRGGVQLNIYGYSVSDYKESSIIGGSGQSGGSLRFIDARGFWTNTAAITSVTFFTTSTSNFKAGTVRIYGVS